MSGQGTVGSAYVVTFAVRNGDGTPRTGLVAGNFTVTVRNPGDTASDTPSVSEVGGGQYRFSISGAFTTTHGSGEYGWTIELTLAPNDLIGGTVAFFANDPDSLQSLIAALNDLSIADVQTALTNQGYTAARAPNLDNLDATVSSRNSVTPMTAALSQTEHDATQAAITALNDLSIADVQTALTNQGYTAARAILLDFLDENVSAAKTLTAGERTAIADALLARPISNVEPLAQRNLGRAIQKLVNLVTINGSTLEIYQTDDTTLEWSQALTFSASLNPIQSANTV